jgi:hypothetical protein
MWKLNLNILTIFLLENELRKIIKRTLNVSYAQFNK